MSYRPIQTRPEIRRASRRDHAMGDPTVTVGLEDFLSETFAGAPGRITISWREKNFWESAHCSTTRLDRAVRVIAERRSSDDLYIGPATRVPGLPSWRRGGLSDLSSLVALAVDLDVEGPSHKGTGYPSDREALALLDLLPEVSWLIATGGGYHVWWVLEDAFEVGVDGTDADLRDIVVGFSLGLRELLGRNLDHQDPAKPLRVPGTRNHKFSPAKEVSIVRATGARHEITDLLDAVPLIDAGGGIRARKPALPFGRRPSGLFSSLGDCQPLVEWLLFDRLGFEFGRLGADGAWYLTHEEHQSSPQGTTAAVWGPYGVPVLVVWSQTTGDFLGLPCGSGQKLTIVRLLAHLDFDGDVGLAVRHLESCGKRWAR